MPTMNKVDLLDCAAGHHHFDDDAGVCSVCGHEDEGVLAETTSTSVAAWQAAVKGGELRGYNEWAAAQQEQPAEDDEPELTTFRVRLGVTVRDFTDWTIEAESLDAAIAMVEAAGVGDRWHDFENGIEGDEIAYVSIDDAPHTDEETEVDLRAEGEPFSWDAVAIVKEMATLFPINNETFTADKVKELISKAHRACTKITGGMEG